VTGVETTKSFTVRDYDLTATLTSGQAFRWEARDQRWTGVIGNHWVRLHSGPGSLTAETAVPAPDWDWLTHYLQLDVDLAEVTRTFPDEEPMRAAVAASRGLRLLRQDPWECLASFILSSTKQIVQIRQIVALLCERYGEPLAVGPGCPPAFAFPCPARLARATEAELRACKMGFRAPYLLVTARMIASGQFDLARLQAMPIDTARAELMQLPGVGQKIADCVLLFAYGFQAAFPVDVWVMKALRQLYFPRRRVNRQRLQRFAATHFGPCAGYAQQYLFHYMRTKANQSSGLAVT
jgi:N-glycosylase/DNA lyase